MDNLETSVTNDSVRVPTQSRSRQSLEAIYGASVELLREGGWRALKLAEVEKRAGVSRGTMYWRFPNVDGLTAYVRDRLIAEIATHQISSFRAALEASPANLDEAVDLAVRAMASVFSEFGEIFVQVEPARPTSFDSTGIDALSSDFMSIISPFLADGPEARRALEHSTRSVFANLVAMVRQREPFSTHARFSWDEGVALISEATTAYLATVRR